MAKSARASSKKANKTRLRAKVFGPVEAARVARLSARLVQLANKKDDEMVDVSKVLEEEATQETTADDKSKDQESMDLDSVNLVKKPASSSSSSAKSKSEKKRIEKDKRRTKPRNQMVFKSMKKKKGAK